MQLELSIKFFGSALSDSSIPEFKSEAPYQAGLQFEGSDEPVGVEFLEATSKVNQGDSDEIIARTIDPEFDGTLMEARKEFFVTRGGKMIGRGSIKK